MNSRYINLFRFFFAFMDLLALNLSHAIVMIVLKRVSFDAQRGYLYLFVASNVIWLLSAYATALYIDNSNPNGNSFTKRTAKTFILFNVILLLFMFIYHYPYSRFFMACCFTTFFLFLVVSRLLLMGAFKYMQRVSADKRRIVIVGYNEVAKTLVQRLTAYPSNFQIEGYFENPDKVHELSTLPVIGDIEECLGYAIENNIHEIYSTISPERYPGLYEIANMAENSLIRFKFVPDFRLYVNRITHMEFVGEIPVLSFHSEPLEDMGNAIKKRLFDVVFSSIIILLILSWLVPLMAILIKLSSRGPVLFIQQRSGKNNRHFYCLKFRTLSVNAEANTQQVTKDDSRITRLGRFLRKTNLDELPQFVNVFMGDMSVVGPRPHMLTHTSMFSEIMSEYMIRHFVKPGVSGWAQVNGYRGEIKRNEDLRKRIEHDIWYIENWSIWLDLKIVWLTIYATFKGDRNAY
jgi:putative colanic acid biosysnthesis UDP-glucose lipid carrier transferase